MLSTRSGKTSSISYVHASLFTSSDHTGCLLQEDEREIALRKMKQEEEDVDIHGSFKPEVNGGADPVRWTNEDDEDIAWANEEPDDDIRGWKLKILIEDDMDGT